MNTPTHFLMTAALRKALPGWRMPRGAVLWGSVAPDLPLFALTFGGLWWYQAVEGWTAQPAARHLFETLYFDDPIWIAAHNLLHSPLSLLLLLAVNALLMRRWPDRSAWWKWFLLACLLHSAVDIATHHDDGPLLFWPFDWRLRYESPVSYWDHRHFGSEMMWLELGLVMGLIGYLVGPWLWKRRKQARRRKLPTTN